eukprot:GILJ01020791.1.p1 GENE.GILJ01020791.1~~GILJ01020791.1.p1  ORF type:complete len:201 (+),score=23.05 GILJ01020791.1:45-647(+)
MRGLLSLALLVAPILFIGATADLKVKQVDIATTLPSPYNITVGGCTDVLVTVIINMGNYYGVQACWQDTCGQTMYDLSLSQATSEATKSFEDVGISDGLACLSDLTTTAVPTTTTAPPPPFYYTTVGGCTNVMVTESVLFDDPPMYQVQACWNSICGSAMFSYSLADSTDDAIASFKNMNAPCLNNTTPLWPAPPLPKNL